MGTVDQRQNSPRSPSPESSRKDFSPTWFSVAKPPALSRAPSSILLCPPLPLAVPAISAPGRSPCSASTLPVRDHLATLGDWESSQWWSHSWSQRSHFSSLTRCSDHNTIANSPPEPSNSPFSGTQGLPSFYLFNFYKAKCLNKRENHTRSASEMPPVFSGSFLPWLFKDEAGTDGSLQRANQNGYCMKIKDAGLELSAVKSRPLHDVLQPLS